MLTHVSRQLRSRLIFDVSQEEIFPMKASILLFLAVTSIALAQNSSPPALPVVLKSENGRFVYGQVGPARADQFLLDTQTGRLWQIVVDKEGRQKLQPVPFIQVNPLMAQRGEAYLPDPADKIALHQANARLFMETMDRQEIEEAYKKKEANQAPEPTPTTVTPPARQESRQP